MDSKELKVRIYEEGTIKTLLEELGCHDIKISHNSSDPLVTASLPDGDNPKGVQIYLNENLTTTLVTRGVSGDVFSLVGYILYDITNFEDLKSKFYQITQYICNTLGYENSKSFEDKPKTKTDWNWWLRGIQEQRDRRYEITENELIPESVLNEFILEPYYGWYEKEGISYATQKEFQIGFHINSERVIIPIHNKKGELIGIKGRYVGKDKKIEDEKKYSYLYNCSKTIELFNLHRALPQIKKEKKVFVVEGAKTTLMLWDNGIKNAVSIEGDKLSPVQVLLLKELGLDIELIFAWDKDKSEEYVLGQIRQIKNRKVSYLLDTQDRFLDKESPCDRGINVFLDLYKNDIYSRQRS